MKALEHVETFEFVEPGPFAKSRMGNLKGGRYYCLAGFAKTEELYCAWCNARPIEGKVRKYCKDRSCKDSAYLFCVPQAPCSKVWRLIHLQGCACAICGLSYEEELSEIIAGCKKRADEEFTKWPQWNKDYKGKISYFQIGFNKGHIWHLDHKVPLFKGGAGFGFENTQVVCVECHRTKTVQERA